MTYVSPSLEFKRKRVLTVPFSGNVNQTAQNTFSSGRIPFKFRITKVKMYFRTDAVWSVTFYWFVDSSPQGSTTGLPSGTNIFAYTSGTPFFISDGGWVEAACGYEVDEINQCIKVHVVNGNAYATSFMASAEIEEVD